MARIHGLCELGVVVIDPDWVLDFEVGLNFAGHASYCVYRKTGVIFLLLKSQQRNGLVRLEGIIQKPDLKSQQKNGLVRLKGIIQKPDLKSQGKYILVRLFKRRTFPKSAGLFPSRQDFSQVGRTFEKSAKKWIGPLKGSYSKAGL